MPAFLVWQLNQRPLQKYFDSAAEGSLTKSIRRSILEQAEITVPPLETQHKILGLHKAILQEKKLYTELIRNADKLMHTLASDLMAGKTYKQQNAQGSTIMNTPINQDALNKALWAACDTFRGTVSADTYKDFILTMLFLKYISDVWQDHYDEYKKNMATSLS